MTEASKPQSYWMGQFQVIETPNKLITYTHPKTGLSVWKMVEMQILDNNFHLLEIADAREKMEALQWEKAAQPTNFHFQHEIYAYIINALNEHIIDLEFNGVKYTREQGEEWGKQVMGLRQSLVEMYKREQDLLKQLKTASNHGFYASLAIIILLGCLAYVLYSSSIS